LLICVGSVCSVSSVFWRLLLLRLITVRSVAAVPNPVLGHAERAGTLVRAPNTGHESFVQPEEQRFASGLTAPHLRDAEVAPLANSSQVSNNRTRS
jgi:hypothetical protein